LDRCWRRGENDCMLLLFDIDGTLLLHASRPHSAALLAALSAIYGIADPDSAGISAAGKTDTQIAREIALSHGIATAEFDARLPALVSLCAEIFERDCPADLEAHVAPGIAELLDALSVVETVRLSLLTGNYERIARTKLDRAGIGRHFPRGQGARAGSRDAPYPRQHTTIIGDTPLDIACARADGLQVIAIATGPYEADALSEADAVVNDAYALRAILQV
jgi:phosphoglycolate phosphatase